METDPTNDEQAFAALLARRRKVAHILAMVAIAIVSLILVLGAVQAIRYDRCMQNLDCTDSR